MATKKKPKTQPAQPSDFDAFQAEISELRRREKRITSALAAGLLKGPQWKQAQADLTALRNDIAEATNKYLKGA